MPGSREVPKSTRTGCLIAAVALLMSAFLVGLGLYFLAAKILGIDPLGFLN